jgi:hypothetical protein
MFKKLTIALLGVAVALPMIAPATSHAGYTVWGGRGDRPTPIVDEYATPEAERGYTVWGGIVEDSPTPEAN